MHFSRVLMQWALLAACGALAAPRGSLDMEPPMDLQAIEAPPPDQETFGYLLPRLAAKYRPSLQWGGVADPRLYILTEMENMQDSDDPLRSKRKQPSMSIVNPMDVLRQRLLLEIARKQMRENEIQAEKNRVFFKNVGKRNNNNMASYNNNLATDNNNLANGFNNNLANGFNNDFSPLPKRGLYSKMADVDSDRQAAVNAYFASGANNL